MADIRYCYVNYGIIYFEERDFMKKTLKKSSFVEGTVIATLAIVFTKILGMLYVIPFYHMLDGKGTALYGYAYSIYIVFLDISSAGLPIAISKIISEYNALGKKEAKVYFC